MNKYIKAVCVVASLLVCTVAFADTNSIRQAIESKLPKAFPQGSTIVFDSLMKGYYHFQLKSDDPELPFALTVDGNVQWLKNPNNRNNNGFTGFSDDGSTFRFNEQQAQDAMLDGLRRLDKSKLIKFKFGAGKRQIVLTGAFDCVPCRKVEAAIKALGSQLNATVYLIPILQKSDAKKRQWLHDVWCAKDPAKAWDEIQQEGIFPKPVSNSCSFELRDSMGLAIFFDGLATPTFIFEDGSKISGMLSNEKILANFR